MPSSGDILARCEPMTYQGKVIGSILTVQPLPAERTRTTTIRPPQPEPDWSGLVAAASNIAQSNGRLLVHGEPATGKATLIEQAVKVSVADVFDVHDHLEQGLPWLTRLESRIRAVPASIAIKHLDKVPAGTITRLGLLIHDALDQGTVVCSTAGTSSLTERIAAPLWEVFDQADLELPPLRQRRNSIAGDVEEISRSLFPEGHRPFTADAMSALVSAVWVNNYRQLHEVINQVADGAQRGGQPIEITDLPAEFQPRQRHLTPLEEAQVVAIRRELRLTGGNKKEAAARLGISRGSLYSKIRTYRISGQP
jgi:transcriptional regulator of acetoin/glycerol metabolism